MNVNRLIAVAGVIIGIIGLFMKSLTTAGEQFLAPLNQANPDVPGGIPTIWGGLDTWAQVVVVIFIGTVLFLALRPPVSAAMDRNSSMVVAGIGVLLLVYSLIKFFDAGSKASDLAGLFGQLAGSGAVPEAFSVARGLGFVVLIIGTVLVVYSGAVGLAKSESESA